MAAGGAGGAASTVLIWALSYFGVEVPAEVAAAAVTLASFGAAYMKKEKKECCA